MYSLADLQFDWFGFSLASKSFLIMTSSRIMNPNQPNFSSAEHCYFQVGQSTQIGWYIVTQHNLPKQESQMISIMTQPHEGPLRKKKEVDPKCIKYSCLVYVKLFLKTVFNVFQHLVCRSKIWAFSSNSFQITQNRKTLLRRENKFVFECFLE